jgi:hypothetical protein
LVKLLDWRQLLQSKQLLLVDLPPCWSQRLGGAVQDQSATLVNLQCFFFVFFCFFLPLFVKLENYNFGKGSQTMNKVKCFIFYEKNSKCILQMNSTDNTALLTVLLANHITGCDNVFLIGYFLFTT